MFQKTTRTNVASCLSIYALRGDRCASSEVGRLMGASVETLRHRRHMETNMSSGESRPVPAMGAFKAHTRHRAKPLGSSCAPEVFVVSSLVLPLRYVKDGRGSGLFKVAPFACILGATGDGLHPIIEYLLGSSFDQADTWSVGRTPRGLGYTSNVMLVISFKTALRSSSST